MALPSAYRSEEQRSNEAESALKKDMEAPLETLIHNIHHEISKDLWN